MLLASASGSSNEVIAKLKDAETLITNETKREIGAQWKSLLNEEREKYKYLAEAAKEELVKQKELFPEEPKKVKRKLQNRISLRSIVRIVKKLNAGQRNVVHAIGLGGILQLRRTFVLTESHVEECLGINAQGTVIDLEGNTLDACVEVCKNVGLTNGVVQLKDLREYLDKTEEFDDVFKRKFALYILGCFLCPNTKAGVTRSLINAISDVAEMANQNWAKLTLQFLCFLLGTCVSYAKAFHSKFPSLVVWGDDEIKRVLHQFDKIGGYDREGVVVHFTQVGEPSGNMSGVSQISIADVQTMTKDECTDEEVCMTSYYDHLVKIASHK
ncbi:hypothetical protein RHSIM_Rhsim01G0159600 [Rhododendron simsii]|uniref:HMG box domain-containing protein n=1 Tax=Rhododendron simsii TaxID=118357 RepID=A0A834HDU4_RHOSS|nr:hypothetical protein RHSIM_Rhsim01G0159600 [Rhododendron simsii]